MRDIVDMADEYVKNIKNDDYLKLLFEGLISELKSERDKNKKIYLSLEKYKKEKEDILKVLGLEFDEYYGRYKSI